MIACAWHKTEDPAYVNRSKYSVWYIITIIIIIITFLRSAYILSTVPAV